MKLLLEVFKGIKGALGVETLLVLAVAPFHLTVMSGCVWADQFVDDAQFGSGFIKQGFGVASLRMEAVGELKTVVGLNALYRELEEPDGVLEESC